MERGGLLSLSSELKTKKKRKKTCDAIPGVQGYNVQLAIEEIAT